MEIKDQVCSLQQAKRLHSFGIKFDPKENHYEYVEYKTSKGVEFVLSLPIMDGEISWRLAANDYSEYIQDEIDDGTLEDTGIMYLAFTLYELGVMIGKGTRAADRYWQMVLKKINAGNSAHILFDPVFVSDCIITLIDELYIDPIECNKVLSDLQF